MQQSYATSQGMQAARSAPQGQADQPPNHLVRTAQRQLNSCCIQVLKDQSKAKQLLPRCLRGHSIYFSSVCF